jgi:hypothetical protein
MASSSIPVQQILTTRPTLYGKIPWRQPVAKEFRASECADFTIVEDGQVFGKIRLKPSGILWRPKGKRSWYGVTIEAFADYAEQNGQIQTR